jgi:putative glycerol-1-phosphate prenyltransferase
MKIYESIASLSSTKSRKLALLIDPDKFAGEAVLKAAADAGVDYIFAGGSLLSKNNFHECISTIKEYSSLPLVLFPGSPEQVDNRADAILFLSLISGRNADNLIGKHVIAAPAVRKAGIEVIPTGYMLIDGGKITSAIYMSSTLPIPRNKNDIATCTAIAGEMLGLKLIYLDAGSGADEHVPASMVKAIKKSVSLPVIVGGGIRKPEQAYRLCASGADIIVIGTIAEESPSFIAEIAQAVHYSSLPVDKEAFHTI